MGLCTTSMWFSNTLLAAISSSCSILNWQSATVQETAVLGSFLYRAPPIWPPICPFIAWSSTTYTLNLSSSPLVVLAAMSRDCCCPLSTVNLYCSYLSTTDITVVATTVLFWFWSTSL